MGKIPEESRAVGGFGALRISLTHRPKLGDPLADIDGNVEDPLHDPNEFALGLGGQLVMQAPENP